MGLMRRRAEAPLTRAQRRARMLGTDDLLQWVDATLYGLGRQVSQWGKDRDDVVSLEEALVAAEALQAVIAELHRRGSAR